MRVKYAHPPWRNPSKGLLKTQSILRRVWSVLRLLNTDACCITYAIRLLSADANVTTVPRRLWHALFTPTHMADVCDTSLNPDIRRTVLWEDTAPLYCPPPTGPLLVLQVRKLDNSVVRAPLETPTTRTSCHAPTLHPISDYQPSCFLQYTVYLSISV